METEHQIVLTKIIVELNVQLHQLQLKNTTPLANVQQRKTEVVLEQE